MKTITVLDSWGDPVQVEHGEGWPSGIALSIEQGHATCLARLTLKQSRKVRRALERAERAELRKQVREGAQA